MKVAQVKSVRVPVQVVLGETELTVEEITGLGAGSIVELDSFAGQPAELVAAGKPIAKGEVVVIEESFGIRLTKILEQE
jgi:flagellar motor switch protein FliN